MQTIAECVGGCCDGVQLDPSDPNEPDDWPDYMEIEDKRTGKIGVYHMDWVRSPIVRSGVRVYRFVDDSLLSDE